MIYTIPVIISYPTIGVSLHLFDITTANWNKGKKKTPSTNKNSKKAIKLRQTKHEDHARIVNSVDI